MRMNPAAGIYRLLGTCKVKKVH